MGPVGNQHPPSLPVAPVGYHCPLSFIRGPSWVPASPILIHGIRWVPVYPPSFLIHVGYEHPPSLSMGPVGYQRSPSLSTGASHPLSMGSVGYRCPPSFTYSTSWVPPPPVLHPWPQMGSSIPHHHPVGYQCPPSFIHGPSWVPPPSPLSRGSHRPPLTPPLPSQPPGFSSSPLRSLATGRATTAPSTTAASSSGGTANKPRQHRTRSRSVCDPPPYTSHPPHVPPQSSGGSSVETIEVYLQSQCLHCMQQTPLQVNQQSAHAEKDPTRNRRRKGGRKTNQKQKGGKRNGKETKGGGVG